MSNEDYEFTLSEEIKKRLPPDHPMHENHPLTLHERFALPVLLWFFDPDRHRGTGRSYLMAITYIELALRGFEVVLEDVTTIPSGRGHVKQNRFLVDQVIEITRKNYSRHRFEYNHSKNTLKYIGFKAR